MTEVVKQNRGFRAMDPEKRRSNREVGQVMEAQPLSGAELIFAQRMLPHFMAGLDPVAAARAVLDDDARLLNALCEGEAPYPVGMQQRFGFRAQGLRDELHSRIVASFAKAEGAK